MDAMHNASKPSTATISGLAASAAFGLASQADSVVATNRGDMVGSVGVVSGYYVEDDFIEITSTEAPEKRPDVTTEEGVASVRKRLDSLHALFAQAIARGRGTDEATVNKDFGRGAVLVAADALKANMIDSISDSFAEGGEDLSASDMGGDNLKEKPMDEAELLAKHPALHAAMLAQGRKEGEATGLAAEQARVQGHMALGKESGAEKLAYENIESGAELDALTSMAYIKAAGSQAIVNGRKEDDEELTDADNTAPSATDEDAAEDAMLAELAKIDGEEMIDG